jgi:hypothetical protein
MQDIGKHSNVRVLINIDYSDKKLFSVLILQREIKVSTHASDAVIACEFTGL